MENMWEIIGESDMENLSKMRDKYGRWDLIDFIYFNHTCFCRYLGSKNGWKLIKNF